MIAVLHPLALLRFFEGRLGLPHSRSPQHSAIVIGQLGAVNAVLILLTKTVIAWTAQFTDSIAFALVIPGLMLFAVSFMARVVKGI